MNRATTIEIIRRHCRELVPQPTHVAARLDPLPNIQAVLFDIYGTLLVSGAGDITLQTGTSNGDAFRAALIECGLPREAASPLSAERLREKIAEHHARSRSRGVATPEVDLVAVWRDVLAEIGGTAASQLDAEQLAVEYEVRINPVWPMPGIVDCLDDLRSRGLPLGIVSNAQAMTAELFPALLDQTLDELGFDPQLRFFSYRFGESKPGAAMFAAAADQLAQRGIPTDRTVYVGNDMLNDIWAASQFGFRTILFAGDNRSLRLRTEDETVRGCAPTAIITDLASIADCLGA